MFLGPWDQGGEWSDTGINGMARWLNRVGELATHSIENNNNEDELSEPEKIVLRKKYAQCIKENRGFIEIINKLKK